MGYAPPDVEMEEQTATEPQISTEKTLGIDEAFAINLIEMAITNDWQGLIFQDTDMKYQQWKQNNSRDGNKTITKRAAKNEPGTIEDKEPQRNHKERF